MSRAFDFSNAKFNKILPNTKFSDRTWRLNQVLKEHYDGNGWSDSDKNDYVYSSVYTTRLDTINTIEWEQDSQVWTLNRKTSFAYDTNNEYVISSLMKVHMGSGLVPYGQAFWTYDNQHRVTSQIMNFYNFDTLHWDLFMRFDIVYVSNSNYTVHTYFAGGDGEPQQWSRMNFTWDTQGRIISETDVVSADSVTWMNNSKYTYTYHPNDTTTGDSFVSSLAHTMWMQQTDNWEYLYGNMFGMVSQEIQERWNNGSWINDQKIDYSYNTNNKLTDVYRDNWSSASTTWEDNQHLVYSYDTNNNLSFVAENYWHGLWDQGNRYTLTWGQDTANDDNTTPAFSGLSINVSPNPFRSDVSFSIVSKITQPVKYSIYNTKGQLVKTIGAFTNVKAEWDGKDVNNQTVSNGIYFIKADINGKSNTIKVLKLH